MRSRRVSPHDVGMTSPRLLRRRTHPVPLRPFLPGLALVLAAGAAPAAPAPAPQVARITQVTLHPGTAEVLRSARVPAGARELLLSCLPEGFDPASLRLEADAGIRLGPVALSTLPRSQAPECRDGELEARIRTLEDRLAALQAEGLGHELVLGHLRAGAAGGDRPAPALAGAAAGVAGVATLPAAQLAATLATVQRLGQEAAAQQHRLARERERLELELAPLRAERDRLRGSAGQVRRLAVQLQAGVRDGELRLRYLHAGPTWGPAYRAELDTATSRVRLERLAQVRQSTGEDWRGVVLRLSTGSPQSAVQGPTPPPWQWVVEAPLGKRALGVELRAMPAPMAAPALTQADAAEAAPDEPPFEVAAQHGEFGSEFAVPGTVDVASHGQSVGFTLETQQLEARWLVQAVPAVEASAWLLAELDLPAGVWPEGPLQLLREGRSVGQARWPGASAGVAAVRDRLTLPFGRDDNLRVQRLPTERRDASAGFVGQRAERRVLRAYQVENRHRQPVRLRLLEPLPSATDERIEVASRLKPEPTQPRWQDEAGIAAWELTLPPGQTRRFDAEHRIAWPKDLPVRER